MKTLASLMMMVIPLVGCVGDGGDAEDAADDVFLTDDAKADAFGVEDWSPDGAAVLRLVSTASADKLDDEVGLSTRVAESIVAARAALPNKKFGDLAELDAASYVGKTVFTQLLRYTTVNHLYKTSLRVPLLVEDENTQDKKSIASFNTQARAAGVQAFARYTFVDANTDFDAKMARYNERLAELAMKASITIGGEMLMYAYNYGDYAAGTNTICYVGDGDEVADVMTGQAGVMVGEMYSVWGWRHHATKWMEDNVESADDLGDDWKSYRTSSNDVLVVYTNDDDGTHIASDVISRCR